MALSQSNNHKFQSGELVTSTKLNNVKVVQTDTATNNDGFTGSAGQLTFDTTNKEIRLHDGTTQGGAVLGGSGGVTTNAITNNAITSAKIADGNIVTSKILDNNVTTAKIANDAITGDKIADDAVTPDMMHPDYLDPSGGLEFGASGLKIATSSTALSVALRLHSSLGIAYVKGSTHIDREPDQITITDKFVSMADAYAWLNDNVSTTGISIDIIFETSITESTSSAYFVRTTDDRLGTVRVWSLGLYDNLGTPSSTAFTAPVHTINVDQNSSHSSRFIYWLGNNTVFRGIHIVANLGNKGGEYHAIARALGARVSFVYCKITVTASVTTNRVLESVNGGMIRVTSDMYASGTNGHEDPFSNGGRAHGLEIDITGCTGGIGFCIGVGNQSSCELIEFRPGVDRDLSGLHFTGNGTASMSYFMDLVASSRLSCNTKISRNSNTTIASNSVFNGTGYNTLSLGTYTEQGTTEFSKYPGTIAFASGFTSPEDYVTNETFGSNQANGPVASVSLDTEADYF